MMVVWKKIVGCFRAPPVGGWPETRLKKVPQRETEVNDEAAP
jgi:hypothetical protein